MSDAVVTHQGPVSAPRATASRADATASRQHLAAAIAALATMDRSAPEAARDAAVAALTAAVREQDAFLHAVAHDLRNPLTAIHGQSQLLRRRVTRLGPDPADAARFGAGLSAIDAAVARTAALIDGLLDAGRDGSDDAR